MIGLTVLFIVIVVFLLFFFLFLRSIIQEKRELKGHMKRVYHTLYDFSVENDFLLLNNIDLFLEGDVKNAKHIDHILFGDKYVYVIQDFARNGGLYGNIQDPTLFLKKGNKAAVQIDNPVLIGEQDVEKLEDFLDIKKKERFFLSIICYNDSLVVPDALRKIKENSLFVPLNGLTETVLQAEKDNVSPIPHEMSEKMLEAISERSKVVQEALSRVKEQKKKKKA